jgi:hypothetical protein
MKVIVDVDEAGNVHWIGVDEPHYPKVEHPDRKSGLVDTMTMLAHHNENPQAREDGGWHITSQLEGEDRPYSRWERLVAACNHPDAPDHIRKMGLKS